MFPALTASSITLTPPLEDSHTLDIIASAWGWEGGKEDGWGGRGRGGVVREMGVSARVSGRFLNAGVCHPAACLGHTGKKKRGSGLKLADDPD